MSNKLEIIISTINRLGFSIENWIKFIYYNFFSSKVSKGKIFGLIPMRNSKLEFHKGSKIRISNLFIASEYFCFSFKK